MAEDPRYLAPCGKGFYCGPYPYYAMDRVTRESLPLGDSRHRNS